MHLSPMSVLRARGLRPSKKRGQHFLTDPGIAAKIIDSLDAGQGDVVVEIGAGLGALTNGLARRAGRIVAVEVDRGLGRILSEDFGDRENVTVEVADILNVDLGEVADRFGVPRVQVVGNLPYCITAPILLWLVGQAGVVSEALVMMQREVAERITAGPGGRSYGPLTIAVQFWSEPEILFPVSPGCFQPTPGVESAVVRLRLSGRPTVSVKDRDFYFEVVRKVFSQRRKMLKNSLLQIEGVTEDLLRRVAVESGWEFSRRPQELSLESFARLADELGARR
ncbi:MAG: ribosomal RNA small subunit methyltransferase A [Candidatus Eisenbacteria sp.]|nr:ribosomal RNA small subunit methyltransferase A [Candidatus Eisenbacteria bacterium]